MALIFELAFIEVARTLVLNTLYSVRTPGCGVPKFETMVRGVAGP